MIMVTLPEQDVRGVMNLLLMRDALDAFDVRSMVIHTFARFEVEGAKPVPEAEQGAAEGEQPPREKPVYCTWQRIRPYAYSIIKNGGKPSYLKVVLAYPEERLAQEFPDARALFVNVIFDKNVVNIISGAAMRSFSLDKTIEGMWDNYLINFLKENGINITITEEGEEDSDD